jgi:predicted nucleic acid-binding protein
MGETATGTVEQTADAGGIVDTDILVDALRKVTEAITFLRGAERYLTVTTITQMELIQGCRNMAELRRVEQFLRHFAVRGLSDPIGRIGVSLMRRYRLSHGLLLPDALIAATASAVGRGGQSKSMPKLPSASQRNRDFRSGGHSVRYCKAGRWRIRDRRRRDLNRFSRA